MNEIFFDRVGTLFSDGQIVKVSLQSFHPSPRGEQLEDVALLVCRPECVNNLIEILQDFVFKTQVPSQSVQQVATEPAQAICPINKNEDEQKLHLQTRSVR